METKIAEALIDELKNEGFPPYCENSTIEKYLLQGDAALKRYVSDIDYLTDYNARDLIKNYVWYAFNKVTNEFYVNYADVLVSWQLSKVPLIDD